ncbi:iron(III) transport system ATP-binding protein [Desulfacinum infernum DSM 9756]|uniref:Iron(III) transport system ATP-binding protein n=1 Tax=Desulfacinum infernum DSM 9756 TaxID=1121391 RepID=A0A1M5FX38_9BACT|nr:ABC transporter ATP-binding protein [Desulfacinum infernum]SHF96105.1 iron(III) transport system ATP-binding protein [Desulfacinum infernum DSM 9756]
MSFLNVQNVSCRYGNRCVIRHLSMTLEKGEIGCLLGRSGCGKSTLLRAIAGFEPLRDGTITLGDRLLSHRTHLVPPHKRQIGLVFQDYALFPHLTVAANVSFGLRHLPRNQRKARTAEVLRLVRMEGMEERYPHEISGGQQQRVAVARALAPRPMLLLLDEPFSNLDPCLRVDLALEVREILKKQDITALMVTHDQGEAFAVADRVGVLDGGELAQWDEPTRLFLDPATRTVAEFVGVSSFLPGHLISSKAAATSLGVLPIRRQSTSPAGEGVDILLRPPDLVQDPAGPVSAVVVRSVLSAAGSMYLVELDSGDRLYAVSPERFPRPAGSRVRLRLEPPPPGGWPAYGTDGHDRETCPFDPTIAKNKEFPVAV